jgi:hypothetical protein
MATYYYVETEGMVFLRVRNGQLCFPENEILSSGVPWHIVILLGDSYDTPRSA